MPRALTVVAPLVLLFACGPTIIDTPEPEAPPSDPADDPLVEHEAVRVAVRAYADALQRRDAAAASEHVVAETFDFYDELRIAALRSTRAQLERWDLLSVFMVLQLRASVSAAELEALDGRGLFELAVREGLAGDGVDGLDLDEVWLADDRRSAQIREGRQASLWLRKTERDGGDARWRVDIPELVRQLGPTFEIQAREQVVAEGKIRTAYTLLQLSSERAIETDVLDPPVPAESQ